MIHGACLLCLHPGPNPAPLTPGWERQAAWGLGFPGSVMLGLSAALGMAQQARVPAQPVSGATLVRLRAQTLLAGGCRRETEPR